jgi:hypothetical protein
MNISELPMGSAPKPIAYPHFPTRWQQVLFRNWGLVSTEILADILHCTPEILSSAAVELGLPAHLNIQPRWRSHSYLTLIRNNWQLLNYEQLLTLLGWTPEKLAYTLKEEDFCFYKLGQLKPACAEVRYTPLNETEKARTAEIRAVTEKYFSGAALTYQEPPFAFADAFKAQETTGF